MAFQPINDNNLTNNNDTQIEQDEIKTDLSQWNTYISNHQPDSKFTFNPNNTQQPDISASQPIGQTIGQQLGLHMAYQNNKSNEPPVGIKMDFKLPSSSTIPIPTAHPNPMVFGCLGPPRVERHPETGRPINQPSGNFVPFGQNDKKKLIASLYAEFYNLIFFYYLFLASQ
jgi:hypothetical protein